MSQIDSSALQLDWEDLPPLLLARDARAEKSFFSMAWSLLAVAAEGQFGIQASEVEDFVLEVIEKTLVRLEQYDCALGRFRTWVFVVARRHAIDLWRKKGRSALDMVCEFDLEQQFAGEAGDSDREEFAEQNLAALLLARLPAPDQRLLDLAFGTGLTSAEIGVELGLNAASVRQRVRRIVIRLRDLVRHKNASPSKPLHATL